MKIQIPTKTDNFELDLNPSESCVLLGANGAGKTRLSIYISEQIPQILQEIQQATTNNKNYLQEIENWTNISNEEIEQQFNSYNNQYITLEDQQTSLYPACEWLLQRGFFKNFNGNSFKESAFPIQSLESIEGGVITTHDNQLSIDVDLLKFSEQYRTNLNAITDYKNYKIDRFNNLISREENRTAVHGINILKNVFRIAAHRALNLNTDLSPTRIEEARNRFENNNQKFTNNNPTTGLQNDFDLLIIALYSEEADIGAKFIQNARSSTNNATPKLSSIAKLVDYWNEILPHREVILDGLKLKIKSHSDVNVFYNPSEMSDGERNIFYILGQCLLAPADSLLIIDEPELHINKAIMTKLWNYIQQQRLDCSFMFITHDIEFINTLSCKKYVIHEHTHPNKWEIESLPIDNEIPEEIKISIIGSREPILFIEGKINSIDNIIYKKVYSSYKIISVESCEAVKSYTRAFNKNTSLSHTKCYGIIDKDNLNTSDIEKLENDNIYTLNVAMIENLFFIEEIANHIASKEIQNFNYADLKSKILQFIDQHKDSDMLKSIKYNLIHEAEDIISKLKKTNIEIITQEINNINIQEKITTYEKNITTLIKTKNTDKILLQYKSKGLFNNFFSEISNARDNNKKLKPYYEMNN